MFLKEINLIEVIKYLYIISFYNNNFNLKKMNFITPVPFGEEIDIIWHNLIIQTQLYNKICYNFLPNKVFIHHKSF